MDIAEINLDEATFVDVRTVEEFTEDHLNGAINITMDDLFQGIDDFDDMKKPIILYCQTGSRSQLALDFLKAQGFKDIYNGGGLDNLKKLLN